MLITNIKTRLGKKISIQDFTPEELYKIYMFYSRHKDFIVVTKF